MAKTGLKITIEMRGQTYRADLDEELYIDSTSADHINTALAETPGKLAYYSTLEVEARKIVEDLENRQNETHAGLYRQIEQTLIQKYKDEKRAGRQATPTVEAVKSLVTISKEYIQITNAVSEARRNLGMLTVLRVALGKRLESLQAIGHNFRAELSAHFGDSVKDTDHFQRLRETFYKSRGR